MSRIFLHYEGEPAFTLKLLLNPSLFGNIDDIINHFVSKYNQKNPSTPLDPEKVALKSDNRSSSKPIQRSANSTSLSKFEDIYIVELAPEPTKASNIPSKNDTMSSLPHNTSNSNALPASDSEKSSKMKNPSTVSEPSSSSSPAASDSSQSSSASSNVKKDEISKQAEQFRLLGNAKVAEKNFQEAKIAYSKGLDISPTDALLYSNRALANISLGLYDEAISDTDYALILQATNLKAIFRRAQALLQKDPSHLVHGPLSIILAERLTQLCSKNDPSMVKSVVEWKQKSMKLLAEKQGEDAFGQFIAAQQASPAQMENFFSEPVKAAREAVKSMQYNHAITIYDQIFHLKPNHKEALLQVADIWIKASKPKLAIFNLVNLLVLYDHDKEQLNNIFITMIKCLLDLKAYDIAYFVAVQNLQLLAGKQGLSSQSKDSNILDAKAYIAKCLRLSKNLSTARAVLISNLQIFEDHPLSLDEYGRTLEALGLPLEALKVYLKMMVLQINNGDLKEHFASVLRNEESYKFFREQLDVAERPEQFYAYIASGVKEFGAVQVSVDLYKACLEFKPNHPSFVLNLVHDLEVLNDYPQAFKIIKKFMYDNRSKYVGPTSIGEAWNCIRHMDDLLDHQFWKPKPVKKSIPEAYQFTKRKSDLSIPYVQSDLDLLATLFTLVKICYAVGVLDVLPDLVRITDEACEGREIHDTAIKNENAYFCCISGLMKYHQTNLTSPPSADMPRIYVAGDSHCMTAAWQRLYLRGKEHLVQPLLVTGLKIWHLRPSSRFFPKNNFYNVVPKAPPKSTIIFLFGEIDCREGFLVSVQKCKYKDLEEAAQTTIDIYMDVLKSLVEVYEYEIYIHPVVPVLDATRHIVIPFMKLLTETISRLKKNSKPSDWTHNIHMLDFFWKLVKEHKEGEPMPEYWGAPPKVPWFFEKEFDLDLTHMNPKYMRHLQPALDQAVKEADDDPHPYNHKTKGK